MSDSDEDNFQLYGTLLEPYDEDAVPKKKAFTIEDQIATDEQGRRRFHGAFTGGFSAGFFNTVGSLEGWQPAEFKSSRSEKAEKKRQKPQDFMDDEDLGEFGIAPSVVRATSDYSSSKTTRKRVMNQDGPIPGVPVLQTLLQPAKDTVGIKLLKQMGWKPGQGVGPRLTKSQKRKIQREHTQNAGKIYGCEIPAEYRQKIVASSSSSSSDDDDDDDGEELTFAPDDYDPFIAKPKDNTFGMGYSGLDKRAILSSHISLFDPPEFKMRDHKNSKISVSGQAFGVGAFEHEDEDIYTRDDMSKYDFELDSFSKKNKSLKKIRDAPEKLIEKILEGFVVSKNPVSVKKSFAPPVLPKNFIPKHGVRMSRFEPLPETHKLFNYDRTKTMGRHDLNASERAKIINSETVIIEKTEKKVETKVISTPFNVPLEKEKEQVVKNAAKLTEDLQALNTNFKPFILDPDKQKRYEQYLTLEKLGRDRQLHEIQPASMADWEKERERYEFAQAARMFKPVAGLVFDKFVAASTSSDIDPLKTVEKTIYQHGTQDMRDAAKKKMFGPLTRTIEIWVPNKLLCRRFNVPEPDITETEMSLSKKKKGKYNVFDYYEAYQQNKTVKEGPELKKDEPKRSDNIEADAEKQNTVEESSEIPANTVANTLTETSKEPIVQEEKISETKIETFKTSRSIFLEESTNMKIAGTSNSISSSSSSSNSNTNTCITKSYYKKSEPIKPQPVIPTDPKEKKDLFKAIFLSSSESEDENCDSEHKEQQNNNKMDEMKKIVLEEQHTTKFEQPIINASKGIFSNLDWSKVNRNPKNTDTLPSKQVIPKDSTPLNTLEKRIDEDIYGPKLPTFNTENDEKQTENLEKNEKLIKDWKPTFQKKANATKESSSSSEDEWMEADSTSEKTIKASKKHKKHKSKHKKHKSKHKKKKSKH